MFPKAVQLYTQRLGTVTFPAALLSLIESCNDMLEGSHSMVVWGKTDIWPRRPVEVYILKHLEKPILFTM